MRYFANAFWIVLVVIFLPACSSIQEIYKEPVGGSKASIRFVAATPLQGNVFSLIIPRDGTCGPSSNSLGFENAELVAVLHGAALANYRKKIGMPAVGNLLDRDYTEVYVQAEKILTVDMHSVNTVGTPNRMGVDMCNVTVEFLPKTDGFYEVVYSQDSMGFVCAVNVFELSDSSLLGLRKNVDSVKKRKKQCFWN